MDYRREIDGLRSIAVLAVVFYHFAIPGFGGGFVGVDVFFVISGFLIGGILWREKIATGRLSLARFYLRRIRRLAPAYFAMALVSLGFAYAILLPYEFREFGKGLIAATIYLSNFLFYRQAGYFDGAAEEKILLHTWSLSVEEQFYIVLPLLILLLGRWHRGLITVLLLGFIASIASAILITQSAHTAAFYLFPFRAWELLSGVLLAILGHQRKLQWNYHGSLSWLGLALVIGAVLFVEPGPQFPGYQVIAPVLGTWLLILNGRHGNLVNRFLIMKGPVAVGLISYSLYIWHWPILTLSTYWRGGYDGLAERFGWMALVLVVAFLSWRLVELPVRRAQSLSGRGLLGGTVLASAILVSAGGWIYLQNGMPTRFKPEIRVHINASADFLQDWGRCYTARDGAFAGLEVCDLGPDGQPPEYLIWGDSHLRAFMDGIGQAASETEKPGLLVWRAGCAPFFGLTKQENTTTAQEDAACVTANDIMARAITQTPSLRRLMLVGRWSYYAEGRGVGRDVDNTIHLEAQPGAGLEATGNAALFAEAAVHSLTALAPHFDEVFVLRQVPEIPRYDSRSIARDLAHRKLGTGIELTAKTRVWRRDLISRTASSDAVFQAVAQDGLITYVDLWDRFCGPEFCTALQDGQGWYFDNNHVTNTAARALRDVFLPLMDPKAMPDD